jgi:hypothetical protein
MGHPELFLTAHITVGGPNVPHEHARMEMICWRKHLCYIMSLPAAFQHRNTFWRAILLSLLIAEPNLFAGVCLACPDYCSVFSLAYGI